MAITINVKKNGFPSAPAKLRSGIGRNFKAMEESLLADMRRRTPVDEGDLRDSEDVKGTETTLTLTAGTDHALYVHQGTHRMGARPFMADALNAVEPGLGDAMQKALDSLA